MFGFLVRAAPQALLLAFLAAITARVLGPLIDFMTDGPATTSDPLVSGLQSVESNFLLVGVVALLLTMVARAVVEARLGGAGR